MYINNYIPTGILCCNVLGLSSEFARFQQAKTKRVRRLFQYVLYLTRPKDIYPQRGLNTAKLSFCAAKVLHFFDICKREGDFFRFFGMIDTKQAQKNGPKSVFYSMYKGTKMAIEQLREKPCKEAVLIHYLFVRHCSLQV